MLCFTTVQNLKLWSVSVLSLCSFDYDDDKSMINIIFCTEGFLSPA